MADRSALPKPGDTIAAKYLVERTIGSGGMSVVFGAQHRITGKRFAIKWLLPDEDPTAPEGSTSAEAAARFIREAQVAGRFQHPNIVEVYDVGQVSGSFYMVMDWLEGESLAARLDRAGPLSLQETCRLLIPCMHGMDDAHAAGIVHRDLKPANIFICAATKHGPEVPKVLDFGIAKLTNRTGQQAAALVTKLGVLIGTPHYLSPEQLRGQQVDHRTDIYAFGVILYQVLSGQLPFPAVSFGELVVQITSGDPASLRASVPGLPAGVEALIARAMARDPADRFQDLRELIAALETLLSAASPGVAELSARPSGATPRPALPLQTPLATESQQSMAAAVMPKSDVPRPDPRTRMRLTLAVAVIALVGIGLLLRQLGNPAPVAAPGSPAETATAAALDPKPTQSAKQPPSAAAAPPGSEPAAPAKSALQNSEPAHTAPSTAAGDVPANQVAPRGAVPEQPPAATATPGILKRAGPRLRTAVVEQNLPAPEPAAEASPPPAISDKNPLHMRLQ